MASQEGKANHKHRRKSVLLEKAMAINNIFKERVCDTKESHEQKKEIEREKSKELKER